MYLYPSESYMAELWEKFKMFWAIGFYFVVWYPLAYVVYPLLKIIYSQAYIFACLIMLWMIMVIFKTPEAFSASFAEHLLDVSTNMSWLVAPVIGINGVGITPFMLLLAFFLMLVVFRLINTVYQLWNTIKMWSGGLFVTFMWIGLMLIGRKDRAGMFLKNTDELKAVLLMVGVLILVIVMVGIMLIGHQAITHMALFVANSSTNSTPPDMFDLVNTTEMFSTASCIMIKTGAI